MNGYRKSQVTLGSILVVALAIAIVGVPIWVIVVNSMKPYTETVSPNLSLPHNWQPILNYETVLAQSGVIRGFLNTAIVLAGTIVPTIFLSAAAAWAIARSKSHILRVVYYVMLIGVAVPPAIVASIFVLKALGLYGGLPGLTLLYCAWFIPLGIFLTTGFVRAMPVELEEAARIDGASSFVVFRVIVLPLLTPVLITTSLIVVIAIWNDFLTPYMMLNDPNYFTQTLSLFDFSIGSTVGDNYQWNLVFADIVVSSLPMLIVYYLSQRYIVYGLSGSMK